GPSRCGAGPDQILRNLARGISAGPGIPPSLVYLRPAQSGNPDLQAARTGSGHPVTWRPSARAGLLLLLILIGSALLRLTHLGYSHFQGDEIKAQFPAGADFPDFL